jgi:hypothetical protein
MKLSKWKNWDKLTEATARFILEQAEKNLSETINAADIVTNRAAYILQFCLVLLIGLTGYLTSDHTNTLGIKLSVISIVFLMVVSILSFRVYRLYNVKPHGNKPSYMISDEKTDDKRQLLIYIFNAIKTTERSIDFNQEENIKSVKELKFVFWTIWGWIFVSLSFLLCSYF